MPAATHLSQRRPPRPRAGIPAFLAASVRASLCSRARPFRPASWRPCSLPSSAKRPTYLVCLSPNRRGDHPPSTLPGERVPRIQDLLSCLTPGSDNIRYRRVFLAGPNRARSLLNREGTRAYFISGAVQDIRLSPLARVPAPIRPTASCGHANGFRRPAEGSFVRRHLVPASNARSEPSAAFAGPTACATHGSKSFTDLRSESQHLVRVLEQLRRVRRGSPAPIDLGQMLVGRPTGDGTSLSDVDRNRVVPELRQ